MGLSDVRLLAFDMDGTLLNGDSQMTDATREVCRALQKRGYKLLLSTGRTYASAQVPTGGFAFDGYVCSNGAAVFEADGTLVQSTLLPPELVEEALEVLGQRTVYYEVHDTDSNRWMAREDRERIEALLRDDTSAEGLALRRFSFYHWARIAERAEVAELVRSGASRAVKLFVWHRDPKVLRWVRERLARWSDRIDITSSGETNIEIIPKGVTKWEGVRYFCRKWNIPPAQVMAFGDADNDLPILSQAGVPVAMENAADEVKRTARFVAPHHDADGVARFLREHLLGGGKT